MIGEYRDRVTIQVKTVTRSATGVEVITWATLATVWCKVEDLTGREFFAAQKENSEVTTRIRLRQYRAGLRADMRALFGSRAFDVLAVLDTDSTRRQGQHLMCRVVV